MTRNWMFLLLLAPLPALSQEASHLSSFAGELDSERTVCIEIAKEARSSELLEDQRRRLDSSLAQQQIRNDVSVYSVGHGRNQSSQYMLDRMQQQAQSEREGSEHAAEVSKERSTRIATCVADAVAKGKSLYGDFKKAKRPKATSEEAAVLITAWIVNMESISLQSPEGSDISKGDWLTARTHAQL